jgi:hypothetical protein
MNFFPNTRPGFYSWIRSKQSGVDGFVPEAVQAAGIA